MAASSSHRRGPLQATALAQKATSGGLDGWGWNELQALPLSWFVGLAWVEDTGTWPEGLFGCVYYHAASFAECCRCPCRCRGSRFHGHVWRLEGLGSWSGVRDTFRHAPALGVGKRAWQLHTCTVASWHPTPCRFPCEETLNLNSHECPVSRTSEGKTYHRVFADHREFQRWLPMGLVRPTVVVEHANRKQGF